MAALNASDTRIPQPLSVSPLLINIERATKPATALPVWVSVAVDDGSERVERGFAHAWTRRHVLVQVLWKKAYYRTAIEFLVDAERVQRRIIEPQWLGRE